MSSEPTVVLSVPSSIMVRQQHCSDFCCYMYKCIYVCIYKFLHVLTEQVKGGESEKSGGGPTERSEVGAVLRCEGGL